MSDATRPPESGQPATPLPEVPNVLVLGRSAFALVLANVFQHTVPPEAGPANSFVYASLPSVVLREGDSVGSLCDLMLAGWKPKRDEDIIVMAGHRVRAVVRLNADGTHGVIDL